MTMDRDEPRLTAAATTDGLPVAPSLGPALSGVRAPRTHPRVDRRTVALCGVAVLVAVAAGVVAQLLTPPIGPGTNPPLFRRFEAPLTPPARQHPGAGGGGGPLL